MVVRMRKGVRRHSISIIVPTYNERKNITILLPRIERLFKEYDYEVLVVDDSSPDGTGAEVTRRARKNPRLKLVTRTKKEGIGAALRDGYTRAKNDLILSTDADLSFEPRDLLKIVKRLEAGDDLVVANRHGDSGNYEKTTAKVWLKSIISKSGNTVLTRLFFLPVHDLSANFRGIRRTVWKAIKTQENGNAILGEMVIKAHRKGYRVTELPIRFRDRRYGESKLSLMREAPKFLLRVIRYRFS